MHHIYTYSGIPMDRLLQLDIYEYRILLNNTLNHIGKQSREGQEALNRFRYLQEEHIDIDSDRLESLCD